MKNRGINFVENRRAVVLQSQTHLNHRPSIGLAWRRTALPAGIFAALLLTGCDDNPLACTNPQSTGTWPFDMKWCFSDENSLPLNPFYFNGPFQDPRQTGIPDGDATNAAHDVTFDTSIFNRPYHQMMSYNLGTAFTGRCAHWYGPVDDGDCNLDIITPWLAGVNLLNSHPDGSYPLHLEFLTEETLDRFDGNAGWKKIHQTDEAAASAQLQNARVMASGVWAMDTGHDGDAHAEVHPVFALAIQTKAPSPTLPGQEVWQFFARRQGDNNHGRTWHTTWPDTAFRFPLRGGVLGAPHADDLRASDATRVTVSLNQDSASLLLTLHLPDESDWVCGTLTIPYGALEAGGGATVLQDQRVAKLVDGLALTSKQSKELLARVRETNTHVARLVQTSAKFQERLAGAHRDAGGTRNAQGPIWQHERAESEAKGTAPAKALVVKPNLSLKAPYEAHRAEIQTLSKKADTSVTSLMDYVNRELSAKQRQVLFAYLHDDLSLKPTGTGHAPAQHPRRVAAVKSRITGAQREEAAKKDTKAGAAPARQAVQGKKLPKVVAKKAPADKPAAARSHTTSLTTESAHALAGGAAGHATLPVLREFLTHAEKALARHGDRPAKK
jgi:hypothetical protein